MIHEEIRVEVNHFLRNIAWLRAQNGLSQKAMAKLLHIGVPTLKKIEAGELPPGLSSSIFFYVEDAFGIPPKDQFKPLDRSE